MRQFLADQIDQLDLALDQLAMKDRNFDRFALMLVDNVVELTLHQYAQDKRYEVEARKSAREPYAHQDALTAALGPYFDAKVKFAKASGMLTPEVAETIQNLSDSRPAAASLSAA